VKSGVSTAGNAICDAANSAGKVGKAMQSMIGERPRIKDRASPEDGDISLGCQDVPQPVPSPKAPIGGLT